MHLKLTVACALLALAPASLHAQPDAANLLVQVVSFRMENLRDRTPIDFCRVNLFWTSTGAPVDTTYAAMNRYARRSDCPMRTDRQADNVVIDSVGVFVDSVVIRGSTQHGEVGHGESFLYVRTARGLRFREYRIGTIQYSTPEVRRSNVDSAQLATVIAEVLSQSTRRFAVDPAVLPNELDVETPATNGASIAPATIVSTRRQILSRLGIELTNDATTRKCPGRIVPSEDVSKANCPHQPLTLISIGQARFGGAYWQYGIDERAEGKRLGHFAVRVIETDLDSTGALVTAYDYIIVLNGTSWEFVKRVVVQYSH